MAAAGVDISGQQSAHFDALMDIGFDWVVTVCDHAAEHCPNFPGTSRIEHWPFPDPAAATGDTAAVAAEFAVVRDAIRARIEEWLANGSAELALSS